MSELKKTFKLHVPATGLFGPGVKRTWEFEFKLPRHLLVDRTKAPQLCGASVTDLKLDELEEISRSFEPIENGIRLVWSLKNRHPLPVIGKTAEITIELSGVPNSIEPLKPHFSEKYEKIRKRFFDYFFYSGRVADYFNHTEMEIKFGDQTTYMGQALIFLATEAKIKRQIKESDTDSLQSIREILNAIDELDLAAESYFGAEPKIDGFVARDDIRGPEDPRLKGRWKKVKSDGDGSNPENVSPSGDQIFGLMNGLWFVVYMSGDPDIIKHAVRISQRLFEYVRNCRFELTRPEGISGKRVTVARGPDMRWLSSLLHGLNMSITGDDLFNACDFEPFPGVDGIKAVASFWDNAGSMAADLMSVRVLNPLEDKLISLTFRAHILLMAIAPSDVWRQKDFEDAAMSVNHHLSILFYCIAHRCKPLSFYYEDIELILEKCPDSGPRGDLPVRTGWQRDNRWVRSSELDQPQGDANEYFGVDFLMLHNLATLVFL